MGHGGMEGCTCAMCWLACVGKRGEGTHLSWPDAGDTPLMSHSCIVNTRVPIMQTHVCICAHNQLTTRPDLSFPRECDCVLVFMPPTFAYSIHAPLSCTSHPCTPSPSSSPSTYTKDQRTHGTTVCARVRLTRQYSDPTLHNRVCTPREGAHTREHTHDEGTFEPLLSPEQVLSAPYSIDLLVRLGWYAVLNRCLQ